MATLGAEVLLPGHGVADLRRRPRCARRSTTPPTLLESLHDQTVALMNEGAPLDDILAHGARARPSCSRGPYLRRSTTSPSSSCATCGASTAAGGTATRRTSSRRRTWPSRRSSRRWPAARAARRGTRCRRRDGRPAPRGHLAEWAVQAAPDDAEAQPCAPRCTSCGSRRRRPRWPRACSAGPSAGRAPNMTRHRNDEAAGKMKEEE